MIAGNCGGGRSSSLSSSSLGIKDRAGTGRTPFGVAFGVVSRDPFPPFDAWISILAEGKSASTGVEIAFASSRSRVEDEASAGVDHRKMDENMLHA